ncbi:MAG: methyltransferase domain-containing protein [Bacteroidales bacterium]|nr:methyltransferase domain-containing protein [Bacteroidales bacterium]
MRSLLQTTKLWRMARGVKRSLVSPPGASLLSVEQTRGTLEVLDPPCMLDTNRLYSWRIRAVNQSGVAWSSHGNDPVRIQARWYNHAGESFGEAVSQPLPVTVYPGEPIEFPFVCSTPQHVGDFDLTIEFIRTDGSTFTLTPAAHVSLPITATRRQDIDYYDVFRTANLQENHWWVVGAYHSREHYERSKMERRSMLIQHGRLNPDSRILDVGCGTGQMADALMDYLSDRGIFAGTDIAPEAISFCNATHRRPNFHFRTGGMSTIPFSATDGPFDLAIYFSVFTHTFLDETVLLLDETRKLLAPGGCVIVDVIASRHTYRAAGNRGEMIVNADYFLRLAAVAGFQSHLIARWPWNPQAERLMYRLELT